MLLSPAVATRIFQFNGSARNFGRFGFIRPGDQIEATEAESDVIGNNPDFVYQAKPPGTVFETSDSIDFDLGSRVAG